MKIYHEQTEPLKDYYAGKGILATVHATQGIAEVTKTSSELRDGVIDGP